MPCLLSKIRLILPGRVLGDNQNAHWSCVCVLAEYKTVFHHGRKPQRSRKYASHTGKWSNFPSG